jgi:hypothetical protein
MFVSTVQTIPVGVTAACAVALAWREHGSIAAGSWLPYSIAIALVAATVLLAGVAARPSRTAAIGIAAFGALGLWAILSLLWAPSPSLARDEGLLTLTYALVLGLAVVTLWTEDRRLGALGAVVAVSGGMAVVASAVLVWGSDPLSHYYGSRLAFPISYVNASGSLFAVGFWPAILLAARRQGSVVVRAAALSAAAVSLGAALMTQSKGTVIGLVVATAFVLAVSPMRLRLVPPLALVVCLGALAFGRLTEPYRVTGAEAIRHAGAASLTLALVALLVGLPYALVDAHVTLPRRTTRQFGIGLLAALVVGVVLAAAAFVVKVGDPATWVAQKWRLAHHYSRAESRGSTHLLEVGSNRFDFWRVGLDEFGRHPLIGDGARGFGPAYLIYGRSDETPRRAHSLPVETLGEQGIVGFLLLAVALGAPLLVALRRALRKNAVAVAALGGVLVWLVQACVDWTWTFPADTIPAIVLLGVGAAASDGFGPVPRPSARWLAGISIAVALLVFAPPWLSSRYTERAITDRSPAELDRARFFDPLSTDPLLATVWVKPLPNAIPELERAARKEPRVANTRYTLGIAYLQAGRKAEGLGELQAALKLQPGSRLIRNTLARAR